MHGDVDLIGADSYDIDFIEPQKFIKTTNDYNDIINTHTEDLNEIWLENSYKESDENFVSKGICVKIY